MFFFEDSPIPILAELELAIQREHSHRTRIAQLLQLELRLAILDFGEGTVKLRPEALSALKAQAGYYGPMV